MSTPPTASTMFAKPAKDFMDDPLADLKDYNVAYSDDGGKALVTKTAFTEKAEQESEKNWFGADGLLVKSVRVQKANPDDPMAAAMAGAEIETTIRHEKKAAGYVVSGATVAMPAGAAELKVEHYEVDISRHNDWPPRLRVRPTVHEGDLGYQIESDLADGVLTTAGFTVSEPKAAAAFGIAAGDRILSINGYPPAGGGMVSLLLMQRDPDRTTLDVRLDRGGKPMGRAIVVR